MLHRFPRPLWLDALGILGSKGRPDETGANPRLKGTRRGAIR
jgi:hypothetical protein